MDNPIDWSDLNQVIDVWEQTKREIKEQTWGVNWSENAVRALIEDVVKRKGLPEGWVDRLWEAI